jgi:hypothetical protein
VEHGHELAVDVLDEELRLARWIRQLGVDQVAVLVDLECSSRGP